MNGLDTKKKMEKTAVVTGAARGIGLATTERLLASGYQVVMVDRHEDALHEAAEQLSSDAVLIVAADLSDENAAAEVQKKTMAYFGPAGVLINNAGIAPKHDGRGWDVTEITLEEWHSVLGVNLTGAMLMCKHFIPEMRKFKYGRIINIASSAGRTAGFINGPAYMCSKSGMLGLTRHIAGAFGKEGITANTVAPGRIITPLSSIWTAEKEASYNEKNPTGRSGTPEEVAEAITYLAGEMAAFTNGAVIDVNGGAFMS